LIRLYYTLADYPHEMIEIECGKCGRHGRLRTDRICEAKKHRSDFVGLGRSLPADDTALGQGLHNFMVYGQAYVPVGAYDPMRIANLGIDHWALDGGFGYTYLNPATGWEASAVTGFTYNFRNPYTDYQNGVDWRLDWGTSLDQSPQSEVGSVHADY
jgi:hypothetical protein